MTAEPLKTAAIGTARDYQNLPAWQKAMMLAEQVYLRTESFPEREHAGLAAQLRQTAAFVASAIAAASAADAEDIGEFYREAQSALAELSTLLELASRLKFLETADTQAEIDAVTRLLIGMQHGIRTAARDAARAERDAEREERNRAREERDGDRPYKKPFKKFEDRGDREDRPRRDFKKRDERGDKPFRKRDDRDGGDRTRRDFKKRDDRDGDKPFRKRDDRGDRRGFAGGKKDYSKRDFGGKKPFKKKDRD